MLTKHEPEVPVTPSSGNVFADLGFGEPEEGTFGVRRAKPRRAARLCTSAAAPIF